MKALNNKQPFLISALLLIFITGCKKDETYPAVGDLIYITSTAITGPGSTASTAITNSASGKVSVSPAAARVYVNTPKTKDVTVTYALSGTAVAGTNYTSPSQLSVTIPAGKWYADIQVAVINTPLPVNTTRTIIITIASASNNTQIGIGSDRNYKTFTYTLTN